MNSPLTSLTRRSFLGGAIAWTTVLLASCGQSVAPSPAASPPASSPSVSAAPPASAKPSASSAASAKPAASSAATGSAAAKGPSVKAAWVALTPNQLLWPLAVDAGYFDKYGVNFSLEYVNGSLTSVDALVAGDLQMISVAATAVVAAQAVKQDLVMAAGYYDKTIWRIVAGPGITNVSQLQGATVGVTKVGNADYFAWGILAQHQGWTTPFTYVAANNTPGQITLLKQGSVKAIAVSPPNDVLAEQTGGAGVHLVVDEAQFNIAEQQVGMCVLKPYLTQHRDTALAVLKATIEATHRWKTDPAFAQGIIRKYLKETNPAYLSAGQSTYASLFLEVPLASTAGMAEVIKEVATQSPAVANVTPAQCFDNSLVQELDSNGFIKGIYGQAAASGSARAGGSPAASG